MRTFTRKDRARFTREVGCCLFARASGFWDGASRFSGRRLTSTSAPVCGFCAVGAKPSRIPMRALVAQPQHGRLGHTVAVVADHRPDLAMTPRRVRQRVPECHLGRRVSGRPWPWPLRLTASPGPGLPAAPGPLGHVEQVEEPRGRHARLDPDHLEVLEGPTGPPRTSPHPQLDCRLTQRLNSALHRPIDCSLTLSLRAASAIVSSPARLVPARRPQAVERDLAAL